MKRPELAGMRSSLVIIARQLQQQGWQPGGERGEYQR